MQTNKQTFIQQLQGGRCHEALRAFSGNYLRLEKLEAMQTFRSGEKHFC